MFVYLCQMKTNKNQLKPESLTFYSHCCKKVGKVFVENWQNGSDGPFEIEIIYHEDMVAMVQSTIKIKEKINDDVKQYAFCGDCGSLINPPVSTEFFMKKIKDTLSQ